MAERSPFHDNLYLPNGLSRLGRLVPAGMPAPKLSATSESMWIKHLLGGSRKGAIGLKDKSVGSDTPQDLQ